MKKILCLSSLFALLAFAPDNIDTMFALNPLEWITSILFSLTYLRSFGAHRRTGKTPWLNWCTGNFAS